MTIRPRRSALYMPASNARAIAKARDLDCDVVILDLEDAVAPNAKAAAREQAVQAIKDGGFGRRELVLRVNGLDTPWGREDLEAAVAAGPDAVLVPKVDSAANVADYDALLANAPAHTRMWVMIETTRSLFNLAEIAEGCERSRLACWVMGTNDLAKEMGATLNTARRPFLGALGLAVAAARSTGLSILDGVFNDLDDPEGFAEQCRQGREFGFDGKTLIHPGQIAPCNDVFTPEQEAVAWSRKILDAFAQPENADKGVIQFDGKMVERLHLIQAERILAITAAIAG
jgi:citrate lyase subunit beta / citryl-CoA lyase